MKFQDLPGPETHEDRVKSLAGLSLNALGSMVKDCAIAEKTDWLQSMLDCGLFNLENLGSDYGHAATALAFLHLASTNKMEKIDPEYGVLDRPSFCMRLHAKPETVAFFDNYANHLLSQKLNFDAEKDSPSGTDPHEIECLVDELFANAMVAASALGLPDTLQRLVDASPQSAGYPLHKDILGSAPINFMDGKETYFNPYVFAMQFSDTLGMEILRRASPDMGKLVLVREKTPSGGDVPKEIDILDAVGRVLTPLCVPSAFAKALRDRMAHGEDLQATFKDHIERILSAEGNLERRVGPCMIAYEKEGIFNLFPTHSARMACIHGHAGIIPHLVGIEWQPEPGGIDTQPAWLALNAAERNIKAHCDSIAAYWNRAIADGHPEVVNQVEWVQDESDPVGSMEPVQWLVNLEANGALLAMMNAGLSPNHRLEAHLPTPLEMAIQLSKNQRQQTPSSTEMMMRSYSARNMAHSLIDDMDLHAFSMKP